MLIEGKRDLPIWYQTVMETINTKLFDSAAPAAADAEREAIDIEEDERLQEIFREMQLEERVLAGAMANNNQRGAADEGECLI